MEKRRILFLTVLLLCVLHAQAQWDAPFSQFWMVKTYYNPSFAGESDKIQASGAYKYEWTGVANAPHRVFIGADMPVKFLGLRHGVGLVTHSHITGNERNNAFGAQYTLKIKAGKGMFNIGVQAAMLDLNFDAASLRLWADSTKNNQKTIKFNPTDKKTIDINAGISWTSKNFFAGMGAMHLNQPDYYSVGDTVFTANTDSTLSRIPLSYNFMAGYNIRVLHPLIEIQPMFFAQTSNFSQIQVQAALRAVYNKKYLVGASWRGKWGYSFFAGAVIEDVEVGYAYDLHTSGIGKESGGSHEVSIRYRFPIDLFQPKPMPHKSIRLL